MAQSFKKVAPPLAPVGAYETHRVHVPRTLTGVHSTLDYIDVGHIQDFTEMYYGATPRLPGIERYAGHRAYQLFGKLVLPETIKGKAIDRFDKAKLAAAYSWYGLDIQSPSSEDVRRIRPGIAVLGVAGLITFVHQTHVHPEILDLYELSGTPTYAGPNGYVTPDKNILIEFSAHLERITTDQRSIGRATQS